MRVQQQEAFPESLPEAKSMLGVAARPPMLVLLTLGNVPYVDHISVLFSTKAPGEFIERLFIFNIQYFSIE
jgi:hypothetical protein